MSPITHQRFWDRLPRFAALVACVLMLWPLMDRIYTRLSAAAASPVPQSPFRISHSSLQVDASASAWAVLVTVERRQQSEYPGPDLRVIVTDAAGQEIYRKRLMQNIHNCEMETRMQPDGLRTWQYYSVTSRTLPAERYHSLRVELIETQ